MNDELVLERHGNVLLIRLNRPEARNALTGTLVHAISTAVLDAEADPDIRVIVYTGTGTGRSAEARTYATSQRRATTSSLTSPRWKDFVE